MDDGLYTNPLLSPTATLNVLAETERTDRRVKNKAENFMMHSIFSMIAKALGFSIQRPANESALEIRA